jgi:hypothetical protein
VNITKSSAKTFFCPITSNQFILQLFNLGAMKKWIIFTLLIINQTALNSQTTILQAKFLFKDAKGFQDTILVGRSSLACDTSLNAALGEIKISDAFPDSLKFKVIGTKIKQNYYSDALIYKANFSKRIFFYQGVPDQSIKYECFSYPGEFIVFKCRVTNFPLKIAWKDLRTIDPYTFVGSFLLGPSLISSKDSIKFTRGNQILTSIGRKDTLIFQKTDLALWPNSDKDYVLLCILNNELVSTQDLPFKNIPALQVFPNPASSSIRLDTAPPGDGSTVRFYNATGAFLASKTLRGTEIDIQDLPTGLIMGVLIKDGASSEMV